MRLAKVWGVAVVTALMLGAAAQASVRPTLARPMIGLPSQSRTQSDLYAVVRSGVSVPATPLFADNTPSLAAAKPKRKAIPAAFTPGPFDALDNPAISYSNAATRIGARR